MAIDSHLRGIVFTTFPFVCRDTANCLETHKEFGKSDNDAADSDNDHDESQESITYIH